MFFLCVFLNVKEEQRVVEGLKMLFKKCSFFSSRHHFICIHIKKICSLDVYTHMCLHQNTFVALARAKLVKAGIV